MRQPEKGGEPLCGYTNDRSENDHAIQTFQPSVLPAREQCYFHPVACGTSPSTSDSKFRCLASDRSEDRRRL